DRRCRVATVAQPGEIGCGRGGRERAATGDGARARMRRCARLSVLEAHAGGRRLDIPPALRSTTTGMARGRRACVQQVQAGELTGSCATARYWARLMISICGMADI